MPYFWEHLGRGSSPKHRKLQDGLFQIASQTCNLLVQVNNTNNISYGNNSTNIHCNNLPLGNIRASRSAEQDQEQLVVLLPPAAGKGSRFKYGGGSRKPRLSTVLETPVLSNDEEADLWSQGYALPSDSNGSPVRKWGNRRIWCKPSCIPISIILILIFLVVLLPLLDHAAEKALQAINQIAVDTCQHSCRITLVESIPEGMTYPNSKISNPSTHQAWLDLIQTAEHSIEIASFYWTLRQTDVYPDPTSIEGEEVFDALLQAGTERDILIKIAQNAPTKDQPNTDTELLVKKKAAEVRSLNFAQLLGGGVLHTKMWIIDKKHFYLGSANMDWRALTQIKELGIAAYNCSCLAEDMGKIFDIYWFLGEKGATIPSHWPTGLDTKYNAHSPMNTTINDNLFQTYLSSSPPPFCTHGRSNDIDALLNVIQQAEKFIYLSVMDYYPLTIYTPKRRFWPVIDDALKTAAIEHHVEIRMLISYWNHSSHSEDYFLKSLADISNSFPKVSIEIRRFIVPSTDEQKKIPYARVNHNKYMVTESTVYVGTSNWSGDYFIDTAGVGFIAHDCLQNKNGSNSLRNQLQAVFERDWNSNYSYSIDTLL